MTDASNFFARVDVLLMFNKK